MEPTPPGAGIEAQIGEWKAYLLRRRTVHEVDVDELEDHLRSEMSVLGAAGLSDDESFLVAVKRLGGVNDLAREFARERSSQLWKQLVLAGDGVSVSEYAGLRAAVGFAAGAAVAFKVPALFGVDPFIEGATDRAGESFYARNVALLVLPFLTGFFVWKRSLAWRVAAGLAVPFVAGAVLMNVFPFHVGGDTIPLDVGFIVYNERTYPMFSRLLRELGVETRSSDMSFGMRSEDDGFEYSSRGWRGYLGGPRNLFNLKRAFLGLEVLRFQRHARSVLQQDTLHDVPFEEYLRRHRYTRDFRERIIIPLIAATCSNAPGDVLAFPTNYLFRFLDQHGVLALHSIPEWRWIEGGARTYVDAILRTLESGSVHCGMAVSSVTREREGACVALADDTHRRFDAVVLACHADQALGLLADASRDEREALGSFTYTRNRVVLHTDERVLPRRASARAAWNYHRTGGEQFPSTLTMSYDLNRLQGMADSTTYCVSVNPGTKVAPERVIASFDYSHPVYSLRTLEAQRRLRALQGERNTYFAGAHLGYGFHEDGARSGVEVAEYLGVHW